jgi:hypothetical protein
VLARLFECVLACALRVTSGTLAQLPCLGLRFAQELLGRRFGRVNDLLHMRCCVASDTTGGSAVAFAAHLIEFIRDAGKVRIDACWVVATAGDREVALLDGLAVERHAGIPPNNIGASTVPTVGMSVRKVACALRRTAVDRRLTLPIVWMNDRSPQR